MLSYICYHYYQNSCFRNRVCNSHWYIRSTGCVLVELLLGESGVEKHVEIIKVLIIRTCQVWYQQSTFFHDDMQNIRPEGDVGPPIWHYFHPQIHKTGLITPGVVFVTSITVLSLSWCWLGAELELFFVFRCRVGKYADPLVSRCSHLCLNSKLYNSVARLSIRSEP